MRRPKPERHALRRRLLSWYDQSRRDLPWRRDVSPYKTWVSEIMLQQTTVAAVVPHFRRFLNRFPDLPSLAKAPLDAVLREWAGLGYYARARNLHLAARKILEEHAGIFPSGAAAIRELPGVGAYTAGAIGSIAFGRPVPAVDGNVRRVLARLFAIREKSGLAPKALEESAAGLVDPERPGDWNQALMDLGATVCVPESPLCGGCPLNDLCLAKSRNLQDRLPRIEKRRAFIALKLTCLWIERDRRVLLWKRSQSERLLKGLWGFPEKRHVEARPGKAIKTFAHAVTHHKIKVELRQAALAAAPGPEAAWVDRSKLKDFLVASLWLKCL